MNRPDSGDPRQALEFITRGLLARLCARARVSPRGRVNYDFHLRQDGYQRMLNAVQPGSYVRPHCHRDPDKSESFVVLQGEIGLFTFDECGGIVERRRIGPACETLAVDLRPGVYHCFAALQPNTVVFEGKNGPYDPATDKRFAPWAPEETAPGARDYLRRLLAALEDGRD